MSNVFILLGVLALIVGIGLLSISAGMIFAGVVLVIAGLIIAARKRDLDAIEAAKAATAPKAPTS